MIPRNHGRAWLILLIGLIRVVGICFFIIPKFVRTFQATFHYWSTWNLVFIFLWWKSRSSPYMSKIGDYLSVSNLYIHIQLLPKPFSNIIRCLYLLTKTIQTKNMYPFKLPFNYKRNHPDIFLITIYYHFSSLWFHSSMDWAVRGKWSSNIEASFHKMTEIVVLLVFTVSLYVPYFVIRHAVNAKSRHNTTVALSSILTELVDYDCRFEVLNV